MKSSTNSQLEIKAIIEDVVAEFNETLDNKIPIESGLDTPLYGAKGALDSLAFVSLIIAIEQAIEEKFGITVVLADEKAMSQRNSPFRSVGTLVDYVARLIFEQEGR